MVADVDCNSTESRQESLRWRNHIAHDWKGWFGKPLESPVEMAFTLLVLIVDTGFGAFRHTILGKSLVAIGAIVLFSGALYQASSFIAAQKRQRINTAWSIIAPVATSQFIAQRKSLANGDATIGNIGLEWAVKTLSMEGVSLANLRLPTISFNRLELRPNTYLADSIFDGSSFVRSSFECISMHRASLKKADIRYTSFNSSDISEANFNKAIFYSADFSHVIAGRSDFRGTDIYLTSFFKAHLKSSNFDKANIVSANFVGADLQRASFRGATFSDVKFDGAVISETDFTDAKGLSRDQFAHVIAIDPPPKGLPSDILGVVKKRAIFLKKKHKIGFGFGGFAYVEPPIVTPIENQYKVQYKEEKCR